MISFKKLNPSPLSTSSSLLFNAPHNFEPSRIKRKLNVAQFANLNSKIIESSRYSTSTKLQIMEKSVEGNKIYDDDFVRYISKEFDDRVTSLFVIGDLIRHIRKPILRKEMTVDELKSRVLDLLTSDDHIFREDIMHLTEIASTSGNKMFPFMNGGPEGEHWNKSANGFYDWIDNKTKESILGIELGFKADNYGMEVSNKLIQKKKLNPQIDINLLLDGFVSILMQRPPSTLGDFELNTIKMIYDMRKSGINVYVNDSWNPLSADFLAANHIKLWIFDAVVAFFGGIGIESQFRTLLYDEMDLVNGPFVQILTMMTLLLIVNQRDHTDFNKATKQIFQMSREEIEKVYLKNFSEQRTDFDNNYGTSSGRGNGVNMKISMNVPGYIQDAQKNYVDLLLRQDIDEIYIMAPYFSDHKVAKSLVIAANSLRNKLADEKINQYHFRKVDKLFHKKHLVQNLHKDLEKDKKIHVIFPKKQENSIIAEVSKYYAYYLRDNPIVETRQFYAEVNSEKFEMLHAKQMVVVLKDKSKNWTKYVKFGGSYNPAGRAQNMWELNAIMINGSWFESDEGPNSSSDNPIKCYLENVMKVVVDKYSEPFPWGNIYINLSPWERLDMEIARHLWF